MHFKLTAVLVFVLGFSGLARAVTLAEVIRSCGDDGKAFCPKVSYGKPMQDCLIAHEPELGSACKGVIAKLKKGERVTLF